MVGGGPAGLTCAHRLAMLGHGVTVFEPREKLGGLNEYGIAAYKTPDDFAAREVEFILGIGGIEVRTGVALGQQISLPELRKEFDAVFLGFGLAGVNGARPRRRAASKASPTPSTTSRSCARRPTRPNYPWAAASS